MKKVLAVLARPQVQAVFLLLFVLVIGGLAGAAIERMRAHPWRPPVREPAHRGDLPPEIDGRLGLNEAQRQEIQAILDRHKPETDAVLAQFLPRLRSITDSVRAEIRGVLTVRQQAIFDRQPPHLIGGQGRDFTAGPPRGPLGASDSTGPGARGGHPADRPGPGPRHGGPPPDDGHGPGGPPPDERGGESPNGPGGPRPGGPGEPPPDGASAQSATRATPAPGVGAKPATSGGSAARATRTREPARAEERPAATERPVAPPAASSASYRPTGPSAYGASGAPSGPGGTPPSNGPSSAPPPGQPSGGQPSGGQAPGSPPPGGSEPRPAR